MNKKIIGAILCISIITIGAIPAIGDAVPQLPEVNNDKFVPPLDEETEKDIPNYTELAQPNLTVKILPGIHRGIKVEIKNTGDASAIDVNWPIKVTTRRKILPRILLNASGNFSSINNGTKKDTSRTW